MRRRPSGFSLIELMIAVTLGMLSIAAVGSVFIYGSRSYKQDDKVSRMQDELRFAMAQLAQDLEMAGFYAQVRDPVNDIDIDSTAVLGSGANKDCGPTTDGGAPSATNNWAYRERRAAIFTRGDATAAQANETFPCISTTEFQEGTDIVAIKRLGNTVTSISGSGAFFRTNGVENTIYRSGTPAPTSGTITIYEYRPTVWYIRNYSVSASENPRIPALCRKVLVGDAMQSDSGGCLAQGIVDMQLEFGFDDNGDGVADYFAEYVAAPDPDTVLARVVAVRVHLLARSSEEDHGGYVNQKTYQLASQTRGPFNDGFYRRALSSTVLLRNQANRLTPYSLPSN